jgi:hypothetical protein
VARRFHLKPDAEIVLPDLEPLVAGLPARAGRSIRAFDPGEAGFGWSIDERPVDHLILLSRSDGPVAISPASSVEAMPDIVAETFRHQEPVGSLLREIATLVRLARCWRLVAGPVPDAAMLVRSLPPR